MSKKEQDFIRSLEGASSYLAAWAQDRLTKDEWRVEDVKLVLRKAGEICSD